MVKKKPKWYTIISPKVFGGREVGETISDDPKKVIGRAISVNAKELTGDFKKSHIVIKLLIDKITDGKAYTSIKGYNVSRSYVQRFVRKGMSLIKIIHELTTNDGQKVRVNLMATANGKIQTTKKTLIRKRLKLELEKIMSNMTLDNNVFISTTNKIQRRIVQSLKKVHPLRFVEIKKIKLINPGITSSK